jgi:hypothetical protein
VRARAANGATGKTGRRATEREAKGVTMTTRQAPTLRRLGEDAPVPDEAMLDLRGGRVFDRAGVEIGVVDDLLFDEAERRVRLIRLSVRAPLSAQQPHVLVPVEAISRLDGDRVHVDQLRERVISAPLDDPAAPQTPDHWSGLYAYYGYPPFWQEA